MSHYFDNDPNVKSERESFDYFYRDNKLSLQTDHGVFSKGKIDFGSDLLVTTFLNANPLVLKREYWMWAVVMVQ